MAIFFRMFHLVATHSHYRHTSSTASDFNHGQTNGYTLYGCIIYDYIKWWFDTSSDSLCDRQCLLCIQSAMIIASKTGDHLIHCVKQCMQQKIKLPPRQAISEITSRCSKWAELLTNGLSAILVFVMCLSNDAREISGKSSKGIYFENLWF